MAAKRLFFHSSPCNWEVQGGDSLRNCVLPEPAMAELHSFPYIPLKKVEDFLLASHQAVEMESTMISSRAELENNYALQLNSWVNNCRQMLFDMKNNDLEGQEICNGLSEMLEEGLSTAKNHHDVANHLLVMKGPADTLNAFKTEQFSGGTHSVAQSKSQGLLAKQQKLMSALKHNNLKEFKTLLDDYESILEECTKTIEEMEDMQKKYDKHKIQFYNVSRERDGILLIQDGSKGNKGQLKNVETQLRNITSKMDVLASRMEFHGRKGEKLLKDTIEKLTDHLRQIEKFDLLRQSTIKNEVDTCLTILGALGLEAKASCEKASKVLHETHLPSHFTKWVINNHAKKKTHIPVSKLTMEDPLMQVSSDTLTIDWLFGASDQTLDGGTSFESSAASTRQHSTISTQQSVESGSSKTPDTSQGRKSSEQHRTSTQSAQHPKFQRQCSESRPRERRNSPARIGRKHAKKRESSERRSASPSPSTTTVGSVSSQISSKLPQQSAKRSSISSAKSPQSPSPIASQTPSIPPEDCQMPRPCPTFQKQSSESRPRERRMSPARIGKKHSNRKDSQESGSYSASPRPKDQQRPSSPSPSESSCRSLTASRSQSIQQGYRGDALGHPGRNRSPSQPREQSHSPTSILKSTQGSAEGRESPGSVQFAPIDQERPSSPSTSIDPHALGVPLSTGTSDIVLEDRPVEKDQIISLEMAQHIKKMGNAINHILKVERDYHAQSPEQLNLIKGDRVRLRSVEPGSLYGWGWKVKPASRRGSHVGPKEQGMFPLSYVTVCEIDELGKLYQ